MAPTDLDWAGCANARDLGGLPAADGRQVRDRALVRTDDLTRLDETGRKAFDAYGASLIVDLRFLFELEAQEHPFGDRPAYRHLPFLAQSVLDDSDEAEARRHPLEWTYARMLDDSRETVGAAVRAVVEAEPGPVVVHCVSGKDRTGLLVALLLDLVGVSRERIGADYAVTEQRLGILAMLAGLEGTDQELADAAWSWRTPAAAVTGALEHLDEVYGGARGFLRACGLTDDEIDRLRDRLTEPAGG